MTRECARLSVSNIAWAGESEKQYFRLLSTLGVQGVEIAASLVWSEPIKSTPRQRRDYRNLVSSYGLKVCGLASLLFSQPGLQLLAKGEEQLRVIDYLRETIDLCRDLGGQYLVFGRPQNRQRNNLPMIDAIKRAVVVFREVGAHAADRGCIIGIEPLPAPECDFITTLTEAVNLVSEIDSPGVRLHFDTGAAEGANDQYLKPNSLKSLLGEAASCQINDYYLRPPGTNERSLHSVWAQCLASNGYSGWLTVEMRAPTNRSPSEQIQEAVEFTRLTYQEVLTTHA